MWPAKARHPLALLVCFISACSSPEPQGEAPGFPQTQDECVAEDLLWVDAERCPQFEAVVTPGCYQSCDSDFDCGAEQKCRTARILRSDNCGWVGICIDTVSIETHAPAEGEPCSASPACYGNAIWGCRLTENDDPGVWAIQQECGGAQCMHFGGGSVPLCIDDPEPDPECVSGQYQEPVCLGDAQAQCNFGYLGFETPCPAGTACDVDVPTRCEVRAFAGVEQICTETDSQRPVDCLGDLLLQCDSGTAFVADDCARLDKQCYATTDGRAFCVESIEPNSICDGRGEDSFCVDDETWAWCVEGRVRTLTECDCMAGLCASDGEIPDG